MERSKEQELIDVRIGMYGTIIAIILLTSGNGVTNCA
jgi:hypothetical protein